MPAESCCPRFMAGFASIWAARFVAGIPNRDILLCFRDDEQTVERLSEKIAEDYRQMPHQVTDKLLLITPDGVAPRT